MKALIIIFSILTLNCFGQYDVYLTSVDKNSICNDDTVTFNVHIDSLALVSFPTHKVEISDSTNNGVNYISNGWTIKQIADSNYTFRIALFNISQGQHRFYTLLDYDNHKALPVFVNNCTNVIDKYNKKEVYDYYYFDMGLYKIKINLQTKEKTIEL